MAKYQLLKKDLEPQNTAGLDAALTNTLQHLTQQTELGAAQARLKEQTTAEVFKVLTALQHPPDCKAARKLVCNLNKGCGFGCQIHHAVHCFTHAVALNRTMVLKTDAWRYAPRGNGTEVWEQLMLPVSSCGVHDLSQKKPLVVKNGVWHEQEQEVAMGIVDGAQTSLEIPAMPPDVLALVQLFNSRPEHWWVGVLSSYLLRPSALSLQRHAEFRTQHAWASPVVGVHIRRTDKITSGEGKLHSVPEYMSHVERYCDLVLPSGWQQLAQSAAADKRSSRNCSIYLATDEPAVVKEIQAHFPHIHILTNQVALATGSVKARNSQNRAQGVYDDTTMLSSTDYLVGTFSSQVSRLAYEIAQVNGSSSEGPSQSVVDRSLHYHSVDSMW